VPSARASIVLLGLCQFFMWFYNGPVNTTLVNCVPSGMRARAFSLSILSIHILGDAISPPIIGAISDATGNLTVAVLVAPVMLAVGGVFWGIGWRRA
jgi:fucose permease